MDVDVRTLVFSFYTHRLCTPTITNILQYLCLHRLRAWTDMDLREERDDGGKKGGGGEKIDDMSGNRGDGSVGVWQEKWDSLYRRGGEGAVRGEE